MKEILKKIRVRNGIILNNDDLDELMSTNNIGKKNLSKILIKNPNSSLLPLNAYAGALIYVSLLNTQIL